MFFGILWFAISPFITPKCLSSVAHLSLFEFICCHLSLQNYTQAVYATVWRMLLGRTVYMGICSILRTCEFKRVTCMLKAWLVSSTFCNVIIDSVFDAFVQVAAVY